MMEGNRLVLEPGSWVVGSDLSGSDTILSFTGGSVLLVGVTKLNLALAFA
jgi:hypothetical protein